VVESTREVQLSAEGVDRLFQRLGDLIWKLVFAAALFAAIVGIVLLVQRLF
jgi:hypothetical protein